MPVARRVDAMNKNLPHVEEAGGNVEFSSSQQPFMQTYILQTSNVEHITQAFLALNKQWQIVYLSQQAIQVLGKTREVVIGKSIWEVFPEMVGSPLHHHCLQAIANGNVVQFEVESPRYAKWFHIHIFPSPGEIGIFLTDITEHKRLEAEVRQARHQLETILHNIADGILVQDTTGTIIYANHKAAMLAGYTSAEDILQMPSPAYWEQFEITDEEGHRLPLSQLPAGRVIEKETSSQINARLVLRRTRQVRWVSIKSTAVLAGEQVPPLVISVLEDITQFKELEQHKDEFIMHVSHELRTPLAAVSGYLELLQDHGERLDASSKAQFLNQALENCQVLADLVNTVINVLKIKQDAKPIKSEQLAVASLVREVIEQFDPRKWQEYHCRLDIPEDLFVYADKQYLCQVLRNLISNVFKYAPEQTPLLISATPIAQEAGTTPQVCISVQDAGPGIPPAEQQFLFQKFIRLKRDLSSTVRGTGLGLYICKELLAKMDGRIWVESSGKEGEGSRFSFTLPAGHP